MLGTCLMISQIHNNSWRRAAPTFPTSRDPLGEASPPWDTPGTTGGWRRASGASSRCRTSSPRVSSTPSRPPDKRAPDSISDPAESNQSRGKRDRSAGSRAARSGVGVPDGWWTCSWFRRSWRRSPRWAWRACAARRRGSRSPWRPRSPSPRSAWDPTPGGLAGQKPLPGQGSGGGRRIASAPRRRCRGWGGRRREVSGGVRNSSRLFVFPALFRLKFSGARARIWIRLTSVVPCGPNWTQIIFAVLGLRCGGPWAWGWCGKSLLIFGNAARIVVQW